MFYSSKYFQVDTFWFLKKHYYMFEVLKKIVWTRNWLLQKMQSTRLKQLLTRDLDILILIFMLVLGKSKVFILQKWSKLTSQKK